ncbi:MAG: nucleotidyltransferase domain-containing protein [Candidatus Odinarchaeota archaeon]
MLYVYELEVLKNIEEIIKKSKESIYLAVLYGSVARRDHKPDSDIDLMVVADKDKIQELEDEFSKLYLKYFIPISVKFYTPTQFSQVKDRPFILKALNEGRTIWERKKIG